jgi:hypothetical protein
MQCHCGGETRVLESRKTSDGLKRRRKCTLCAYRFTTVERILEVQPVPKPAKPAPQIRPKPTKTDKVHVRRRIEDLALEDSYFDTGSRYRW